MSHKHTIRVTQTICIRFGILGILMLWQNGFSAIKITFITQAILSIGLLFCYAKHGNITLTPSIVALHTIFFLSIRMTNIVLFSHTHSYGQRNESQ